tara:strand:+ start:1620 stop:2591 length:972 start_codon:yes stop_codon:yes gene_type:complete
MGSKISGNSCINIFFGYFNLRKLGAKMKHILKVILILALPGLSYSKDLNRKTSEYTAPVPIVKLWQDQLKSAGIGGTAWLGPIDGNGTIDLKHRFKKRSTLIFVPSKHDLAKNTDIIIWLHGHWGFNKFYTRILRHIDNIYSSGRNVIIIAPELPWSAWTKTPTKRNGTGPFKNFEEYLIWKRNVIRILENKFGIEENRISKNTVIYGHSAGGSAVKSMAIVGALRDIQPSAIIFSDSSYGRWLDVTYDYYIKYHPEVKVYAMTALHGSPRRNAKRFLKDKKTKDNIVHMMMPKDWTHKRIGDNCLLMSSSNDLFLSIIRDSK